MILNNSQSESENWNGSSYTLESSGWIKIKFKMKLIRAFAIKIDLFRTDADNKIIICFLQGLDLFAMIKHWKCEEGIWIRNGIGVDIMN